MNQHINSRSLALTDRDTNRGGRPPLTAPVTISADRERYIDVQMHGLDCKAAWVRDDARQIVDYARTLNGTLSHDSDRRDQVRASISAAQLALTEALTAIKTAEQEYERNTTKQ